MGYKVSASQLQQQLRKLDINQLQTKEDSVLADPHDRALQIAEINRTCQEAQAQGQPVIYVELKQWLRRYDTHVTNVTKFK